MSTQLPRRYFERQPSALPVQVRYYPGTSDICVEETHVLDVSRGGARLMLSQEVQMGQPVELTLALSRLLRAYDKNEKTYTVWGLIRSVACLMRATTGQVGYEIGVAFIGQFPPEGYLDDLTKRYDIKPTPSSEGFWQPRKYSKKELEMMASW